MKGYFAFPPPSATASISTEPSNEASTGACTSWNSQHEGTAQPDGAANAEKTMEQGRRQRREQERVLGECGEIAWVRAGGVLRDASGRRDKARTERIRQELALQDVERAQMARWEAYETRWRAIQHPASSESQAVLLTFVAFPWPLGERVVSRDLSPLTRRAVSDFLFESLAVRTNTTTKKERIRGALLRWHPDKISSVLARVVPGDLELVREGVHFVFGILRELQDAERTGAL